MIAQRDLDKIIALAMDARRWLELSPNDALTLRMQHFLEADCACIAALIGSPISVVRDAIEDRYQKSKGDVGGFNIRFGEED